MNLLAEVLPPMPKKQWMFNVLWCLWGAWEGAQAATAGSKPVDTCAVKTPPPQARLRPSHGVDLLIWPDRLDANFTGCQKVWLEDGHLLGTTVFKQGKVWSFSTREPESRITLRCRYHATPVRPMPEQCPPPEDFPLW